MDVRKELSRDHEDHEELLLRLRHAVAECQSVTELRRCWLAFEENLLDHFEAEERSLFNVAVQAHRVEVAQLRAEHRLIRQALVALRASLELNALKPEAVDSLLAQLQAHSAHEACSLHRWLELDEGILARRGVLAMRSRRERSSPRLKATQKLDD